MKKLSITQFGKKAKVLNVNDQKRIKGGYKTFRNPLQTSAVKWIEIDIRREDGPIDVPNKIVKGKN